MPTGPLQHLKKWQELPSAGADHGKLVQALPLLLSSLQPAESFFWRHLLLVSDKTGSGSSHMGLDTDGGGITQCNYSALCMLSSKRASGRNPGTQCVLL